MKRSELIISVSLVPMDYLMVTLAGIAAYYVRFWEPITEVRPVVFNLPFWLFFNWLLLLAIFWLIAFALAGLYSMKGTARAIDEITKIILGCSTAVAGLMFVFFFSRSLFDSRFIVIAVWLLTIVFVIAGRGLVRSIQKRLYRFNIGVHRVAVIGEGRSAQEIIKGFSDNIHEGYKVVDQFADFSDASEMALSQMADADKFDEIIVASPHLSAETLDRLNDFSYNHHIDLKYVADIFDFPVNNFLINSIAGLPVVEVKKTRLEGWGRIAKRIFDLVVSAILLILLSPIFILAAILIKLDSIGPVFFSYKRIGESGKPFTYFKFRSMFSGAHALRFNEEFMKTQENLREGTPMMKFKNDPRITRVGKFIRRFSIDELPELFNVFIGKMSLVGPRPHEVEEVEKYETYHKRVLSIKPGMTGMSQVSGRSDLDFNEEVRLDVWYMENWSMKLDLMILFKTPLAVLKKRKTD
jgi:exopolysaccharide biosynthesis polyprenyl glycosylphosphotransferase